MAISFKQLIAPAQVDDVEAAQRRQALAEAMQQRALQGNAPAPGGRVQSRYLPQTALADLAGSLLSSWNLKNANTAAARAKEARAANVDAASKRVALSQPNEQMVSGPGQIMSPLTPEEASADLGRAMGPEGQAAVAKALMERKLSATDPNTIADRDLKLYQVQAGLEDKRETRRQRSEDLAYREREATARAREAAAARGDIARQGNETRRAIADQADATRRAEIERKIAADDQKRPEVTNAATAQEFLRSINFNPKDKSDDVSKIIPKSTGGWLQKKGADIAGAFNITTSGRAAPSKASWVSVTFTLPLLSYICHCGSS